MLSINARLRPRITALFVHLDNRARGDAHVAQTVFVAPLVARRAPDLRSDPTLVHVGVVQRAERVEAIAEQPEYQLVASRLDAAEVQSERVERDYALVLAVEEYPHERAAVLGYPRDQLAVGSIDLLDIVDVAGVEGQRL